MLIKFNLIKEYVENVWLGPELRLLHRAFSIGHHENNKSFTFFGERGEGEGGRGRRMEWGRGRGRKGEGGRGRRRRMEWG
jgi:hypothetical protein